MMKELFKAYAFLTDEQINDIWKSDDTVFIFDTNILINFYSYRKKTQEDFYKIFQNLQKKIWIPYHVMLEYNKNRKKSINEKNQMIDDVCEVLQNESLEFKSALQTTTKSHSKIENEEKDRIVKSYNTFQRKYPDLMQEWDKLKNDITDEFQTKIQNHIESIKKATDNNISLDKSDDIFDSLNKYLTNTGKAYDKKFIEKVKEDADVRFKKQIPPGYSDKNKEGSFFHLKLQIPNNCGDLIIWEEIKKYVSENTNKKNIIFITDDSKEDWVDSLYRNKEKIIFAKPELVEELLEQGDHVETFLINNSDYFVRKSSFVFGLNLNDESVKDVKNTANNIQSSNVMSFRELESFEITPSERLITEFEDGNLIYNQVFNEKLEKIEPIAQNYIKDLKFQLEEKIERRKIITKSIDYARLEIMFIKSRLLSKQLSQMETLIYENKKKEKLNLLQSLNNDLEKIKKEISYFESDLYKLLDSM